MPYFGPSYSSGQWRMLVEYKHSMSAYGLNSNMYTHYKQMERGDKVNKGNLLYIDGHAYTHKKEGTDPTVRPNCQFVEVINDKEGDMERQVETFIIVQNITYLTIGDELLIKYPFIKCIPA